MRPQNLVHSSKNVGEPPLFLGCSVYYAVKQAIYAAREDSGLQVRPLLSWMLSLGSSCMFVLRGC